MRKRGFNFFNKKAIEPVIATVLLIVITIAAVAVVIAFVVPFIREQTSGAEVCFKARLEITRAVLDSNAGSDGGGELNVSIARGSEEFELDKIILQFKTSTETIVKEETRNLPNAFEESTSGSFSRGIESSIA